MSINNMQYLEDKPCESILSANVFIAPYGVTVGENKISPDAVPPLPTDDAPGPWKFIGQVKNAKMQTEYKKATVEGADENGIYRTREMRIVTMRKLTWQSNDLSRRAFRLTFGMDDDVTPGTAQSPFALSNDQIGCWVYYRFTDAYRVVNLAELVVPGMLGLANPINMASDPVLIDWEFSINGANRLATYKELVSTPA